MQNVQNLTGTGGASKYVCKYIATIDEQNYIVVYVNGEGHFITRSVFLHNTKVKSSKIAEDKKEKRIKGRMKVVRLLILSHYI